MLRSKSIMYVLYLCISQCQSWKRSSQTKLCVCKTRANNLCHQHGYHSCDCNICSDLWQYHEGSVMQRKFNKWTKRVHFSTVFYRKCKPNTYSSYCGYFDQLCFHYYRYWISAWVVEVSEYPLCFRSQLFQRQTVHMTKNFAHLVNILNFIKP